MSFSEEFNRLANLNKKINEEHGFNELDVAIESLTEKYGVPEELVNSIRNMRLSQKLMLVVTELGEAMEAVRKGNPPDSHIPDYTGFEAETADAVIRLMNLTADNKSRLADAIVAKAVYNSNRPYRHGGKAF